MAADRVSLYRYAKDRGVQPVTIYKARDRGRITVGSDGKVNPAEADHEMIANRHPRQGGLPIKKSDVSSDPTDQKPPRVAELLTLGEATRRKESALAAKAELQVEVLKKSWREPALRLLSDEGSRVRTALEQWPDRIFAQLAAKHGVVDTEIFRQDLEDAVRELLTRLSGDEGEACR